MIDQAIAPRRRRALPLLYMELAKFRLSLLVVLTAAVGHLLAGGVVPGGGGLFWTCLGTALAAFGANALNQRMEFRRDGLMDRTRGRPLPAGRLSPRHGLWWGLGFAAAGVGLLAARVNMLAAGLALGVVLLYTLVYTPLKTRTSLCTVAGAACGAIPPLIGWAGASGGLALGAWLLAAILFVWQIPHFLSLAWLYRRDYERGGFRMLPYYDREGHLTVRLLVLYSLLLLPIGAAVSLAGLAGAWFAAGSLLLGLILVSPGLHFYRARGEKQARRVFLASLVYLPLLLGLMVADRHPRGPSAPALRSPGAVLAGASVHDRPAPAAPAGTTGAASTAAPRR